MKKAFIVGPFLIVVGAIATTLWHGRDRQTATSRLDPTSDIAVRRLQPNQKEDVVRVQSPGGAIEFVYELSNLGTVPLTQLHARLFCECAVTQKLPDEIAPGETVRFGFQFPPPQAGVRTERITITSGSSPKPIAQMNARVYVDVEVPHVLIAPDVVHVQMIRGQPLDHEFPVSVIERADSQRLIQSPTIEVPAQIEVLVADFHETAECDVANVRRVYRLQLRANAASVTRDIEGTLRLVNKRQKGFADIPLKVEVLEPVTLIPKLVKFRPSDFASGKVGVVNIVRRVTPVTGTVRIKDFDRKLVDVRRMSNEGSQAQRFEVTPKTSTTEQRETKVVFEADTANEGKNELVLLVRLVPE